MIVSSRSFLTWKSFFLLFGLLFISCSDRQSKLIQGQAPDFTLPLANSSDSLSLSSSHGKVRLLVFWASWCMPCLAEIPTLNKLQAELGSQGLQILSINLDEKPQEKLPSILQQMKMQYPILLGNQEMVRKYGNFKEIPISFLIDRQGKLLELFRGYTHADILHNRITIALRDTLMEQPQSVP